MGKRYVRYPRRVLRNRVDGFWLERHGCPPSRRNRHLPMDGLHATKPVNLPIPCSNSPAVSTSRETQHGEHMCAVSVAGRNLLAREMACVRCASPRDDLGGSLLA